MNPAQMDPALAARLAAGLRAADPDRFLAALFVPAATRPLVTALYAFNVELARVATSAREPMLAAIRLEWWRQTAEAAAAGRPRDHDIAHGLAAVFATGLVRLEDVEAMIAARAFDCAPDRFADFSALETYLDATSGGLMRLVARLSGGDPPRVRDAGLAYGLTGLFRSLAIHNGRHKLFLPLELLAAAQVTAEDFFHLEDGDRRRAAVLAGGCARARAYFLAARQGPRPGAALAAMLPAALVPVYLHRLARGRDVPIQRRQLALLAAAMKGRL